MHSLWINYISIASARVCLAMKVKLMVHVNPNNMHTNYTYANGIYNWNWQAIELIEFL